ncbi:venom protease-like [Tropilaelaps mercedesae]|uniref:Venom protease-like n=1 Tax=Tropilaelaps mercedesae TaxID=418985 RepID=A0A1V9XKA5_9ACAR|nr:venom protease-like [Tropilaelaps mercedesae]
MQVLNVVVFLPLCIIFSAHLSEAVISSLLQLHCGESTLNADITDGHDARSEEMPWIVIVRARRNYGKNPLICIGAIVTPRHVITAAHCYPPRATDITVFYGYRFDVNRRLGVKRVFTSKLHDAVYNQYKTHFEDILLLELFDPLKFDKHKGPVCIANTEEQFKNAAVITATYGNQRDAMEWPRYHLRLQPVLINSSTLHRCIDEYKWGEEYEICVSPKNNDFCQSFTGSPLVVYRDKRFYMIGVFSYFNAHTLNECTSSFTPQMYTRITSSIRAFIISAIEKSTYNYTKNPLD